MIDTAVSKGYPPVRELADYLGPAEVIEARAQQVLVSLTNGASARVALAFATPYAPIVGDVLLVIGKAGQHYAIGVLHGSGRTTLAFHGDVDLRSIDGKVSISGDRGVEIQGPAVDIHTQALRVIAKDVTQRFQTLCQRVTSLFRVHAGETQTLVEGTSMTQAKRAAILTEETVTINGREVHLG